MTLPEGLAADRTAFFLDFDGTLVEIAPRPDAVRLAPETHDALAALLRATGGAVAVITGRRLSDLDSFLAPLELPAAGSHGAEMRFRAGGPVEEVEGIDALDRAADELAAHAEAHDLLLERKRGAVSLHFRNHPEQEEAVRALVGRMAAAGENMRAIHGNMVSELALAGVDKGAAVERFLKAPPFAGRMPLVAGDDTTDEDAFGAALRLGGEAIKVGKGPSVARHRAPDTAAFLDWLGRAATPGEAPR